MASLQKTSSQRTKDRIQEIRDRVFRETSDAPELEGKDANTDKKNDLLETKEALIDLSQQLDSAQETTNELPTAEVVEASTRVSAAPDEAQKQQNSDEKITPQEVIGFDELKVKITDEINAEFALLKERIDGKLIDFESKIPDIQKGSKIRDELLNDIETMISQQVSEQKQSIDGVIKKLEMSFASANDLVEMQDNLEKSVSQKFENDLEIASSKYTELDARLESNRETADEFNRSIKTDLEALADGFRSSSEEADKKLKDNSVSLLSVESRVKNSLKAVEEFNSSIREDIDLNIKKLISSNKKFDTKFQNSTDEFLNLQDTIDDQQKSLATDLNRKIKQSDNRINDFTSDADNRVTGINSSLILKINTLEKSINQKFDTEIQDKADRLLSIKRTMEAQQKFLADSFSQKLKTNNEPIMDELAQLDKKYETKVSAISSSLDKHLSSAFSGQEKQFETLRQEMNLLKEKLGVEVVEVKSLLNKQKTTLFDQMANSTAELDKKIQFQTDHTDSKFALAIQKFTQNAVEVDKSIKLQADNADKSFNLLKQEFKDIKNELAIDLNKKIDSHLIEFSKFRKENVTALLGLKESIEKKVNAISFTLEKTQGINQNELNKLKSLVAKDSLKSSTDLKKEIDKLNLNIHKSNGIIAKDLTTFINECNRTVSQKIGMPEVESFFKDEMNQKLDVFSNRMGDHFQTIHKNIKTVEDMILKEDDLTELFKNYTLNLTIGDSKSYSDK